MHTGCCFLYRIYVQHDNQVSKAFLAQIVGSYLYRQITSACGKACVLATAGISLHLPLIAVLGAVVPCHSQQGRHESAQDRGDFGMEFATFLAIIVLILVELLRCCWSCLRCTTATHFAKVLLCTGPKTNHPPNTFKTQHKLKRNLYKMILIPTSSEKLPSQTSQTHPS